MKAKQWIALALCLVLCLGVFSGCGGAPASSSSAPVSSESDSTGWRFTDALGREVEVAAPQRVISLYGSFAECWLLSGGTLVGTTEDAVKERKLTLGDEVAIVGTTKEPNLEEILSLEPDFVILSADIAPQAELDTALTEAAIPHAYFQMDDYHQYLATFEGFCRLNDRADLYETLGGAVEAQIEAVLARAEKADTHPTVLLLRAYSSGVKAKAEDNLAGIILRDLGADNIASRQESLLEDLSIEAIIAEDPDYIFVTTMGTDDAAAMQALADGIGANPAWKDLTAVKNDRLIVLPKDLFHYKPNARWGESYEYLADILFPQQ